MEQGLKFNSLIVIALFIGSMTFSSFVNADAIDDLKPGQWYEIPNSAMRAVAPNPLPAEIRAVEGTGAVIHSWSGGAYDTKRDRLLVWGGGHTAYAGNELYAFSLKTQSWERLTDPSSITNYTEGDQTYPDGRPVSVHSYDQIEYDSVNDRLFVFGGSRYKQGSNIASSFLFDFDKNDWERVGNIPGKGYSEILGLSLTSAFEPESGQIYVGGKFGIATFNVATKEWKILNTRYADWRLVDGTTGVIDPKRKLFIQIGRGNAWIWDVSVMIPSRKDLITSGAKEIESCDAPGLDYDPISDRLVGWCGGGDVYTLNTDTMVWTKYTTTSTVVPDNPNTYKNYHGTFGRFRYVPSKNVFIVVTHIDKNVFVYKLSDSNSANLPDVTITANPTEVLQGDATSLTWDAVNATTCTGVNGTDGWVGPKSLSNSMTVGPITQDTVFSITCTQSSSGLTAGASVQVAVISDSTSTSNTTGSTSTTNTSTTTTTSGSSSTTSSGSSTTNNTGASASSSNGTMTSSSNNNIGSGSFSYVGVLFLLFLSFMKRCCVQKVRKRFFFERFSFLRQKISFSLVLVSLFLFSATVNAVDLVDIQIANKSSTDQVNVPFTFGHIFKDGDVASSDNISARLENGQTISLQVDKKATNNNGSLRHAVISGFLPSLSAGAIEKLTLYTTSSTTASQAVSLDELLNTSFDAKVTLNVGGTVYVASAKDLLSNQQPIEWLKGNVVSEWVVGGPVSSGSSVHPHLAVYFHVRAYKGTPITKAKVDVVVENNWTQVQGPSDFTYNVDVSIGGNSVYSKQNLTHYTHARWHKQFWWGGKPPVYVKQNSNYLQDTKSVPKYLNVTPGESYLNSMLQSVEPMGRGNILAFMPSTGENGMIGPLPTWTSIYVITTDERAYNSMLANADAGGSYNSHYRDENTALPAVIDDHPNAQIGVQGFPGASSSSPYTWDRAHQPSLAFVPYVVTGDYYYLEELLFWNMANMLSLSQNTRSFRLGLQVRGQAWSIRTIGQAAYITPDNHPQKQFLLDYTDVYLTSYNNQYTDNPNANNLGVIWSFADERSPNRLSNAYFVVWMDDFLTWSIGYLSDLGFTKATRFRDWKVKFPVERMTDDGYCWQVATPSDMQMGVGDIWYSNIAEVYLNNFPLALTSLTCGTQEFANYISNNYESPFLVNEMIKYGHSTDGHPSKLRPALAIAVDAGYPNADVAWSRLTSRTDPPDYSTNPKYALVPRSLSKLTIDFDANKFVIQPNEQLTLTWSAPDATNCVASGLWSGVKGTEDSEAISGITSSGTFYLECSNATETSKRAISVTVSDGTTSGNTGNTTNTSNNTSNTSSSNTSGNNTNNTSSGNANTTASGNNIGSGSLDMIMLQLLMLLMLRQIIRRKSVMC